MLALELEKQKEQEKLDEEIALKEVLKEQMGELRSREMEVRTKVNRHPIKAMRWAFKLILFTWLHVSAV